MGLTIAARTIQDGKRSLIGWSIALAVLVAFTLAFYPSIKGNQSYDDLLKDMPEALQSFVGTQSMTSPQGYLESQFFIFMLPLLFLIFAVGRGADSIAGEERRKTIDLLLANPVSRGHVLIEKALALAGGLLIVTGVFFVFLVAGTQIFGMDVAVTDLARATLGSALLGALFGALALSIGALTGKKGVAIGASAAVATAAYFVNSLAPFIEALEPLRVASPFYWALGPSPVADPVPAARLFLVALALVLVVVGGIVGFDRRDLSA